MSVLKKREHCSWECFPLGKGDFCLCTKADTSKGIYPILSKDQLHYSTQCSSRVKVAFEKHQKTEWVRPWRKLKSFKDKNFPELFLNPQSQSIPFRKKGWIFALFCSRTSNLTSLHFLGILIIFEQQNYKFWMG